MSRLCVSLLLTALLLPTSASAYQTMGAVWDNAELPWSMNSGTPASMSFSAAEGILIDSYEEWETQSCTSFEADYNGTTSRTPTQNSDGYTTHGFLSSWPSSWGDAWGTIGITLAVMWGGEFIEADVAFNEQVYTFVDGYPGSGYQADLESIAVHEFGHSLGLDHTGVGGATMYPSYDNGIGMRSLANDDINGLCALYPGSGPGPSPTDDTYEENDEYTSASGVLCGNTINGHAAEADADWYVISTPSTGDISATLTWADATADLDLYLVDDTGGAAIDSSEQVSTTSEDVEGTNQPAGTYYLFVNPYDGFDDYTLVIDCEGAVGDDDDDAAGDDNHEPNDEFGEAASISCPTTLTGEALDPDWFTFSTSGVRDIAAVLSWSDSGADLDLYLINSAEEAVDWSEEYEGTSEDVAKAGASAGTWYLLVNPWEGTDGYTLDLDCDTTGSDDDDAGSDDDDAGSDDDDAGSDDDDGAGDDDDGAGDDDDDADDDDDDDDDGGGRGGNSYRGGCTCQADGASSGGLAWLLAGLVGAVALRRRS